MPTLSAGSSVSITLSGLETINITTNFNTTGRFTFVPSNLESPAPQNASSRSFGPAAANNNYGPWNMPGTLTIFADAGPVTWTVNNASVNSDTLVINAAARANQIATLLFQGSDRSASLANNGSGNGLRLNGSTFTIASDSTPTFRAANANESVYRGSLSVPADGVWLVRNNAGTAGAIVTQASTVANLPAAATAGAGARAFVTDASVAYGSANIGTTVTGGGANSAPVFSNGTNWIIG